MVRAGQVRRRHRFNWSVSCPELPGCHSQGKTRSEALASIIQSFEGTLILISHDRYLLSEVTDNRVMAGSLNYLWHELNRVLRAHRGTLNHYAGDALYAVWEVRTIPEANELAIDFALAANRRVEELAPTLALRAPDGSPIRMGWGVVQGRAAIAAMTRTVNAVIGDATNVAFRLAGIAGRAGRPLAGASR